MAKKSTEVELFGTAVPAFMADEDKTAGSIHDDADLLRPPRLIMVQKSSDLVDSGEAKKGDLYSQIHNKVVCPNGESMHIIPLQAKKEWMKLEIGQGLVWRTDNPNDERVAGDEDSWRYKVVHVACLFPVGVPDTPPMPAILTFRSTSTNIGASWYQQFAKTVNHASYAQVYSISMVGDKNEKGEWYKPSLKFAGLVQDQELFKVAKETYARMQDAEISPQMEDSSEATVVEGGDGDDVEFPFSE